MTTEVLDGIKKEQKAANGKPEVENAGSGSDSDSDEDDGPDAATAAAQSQVGLIYRDAWISEQYFVFVAGRVGLLVHFEKLVEPVVLGRCVTNA